MIAAILLEHRFAQNADGEVFTTGPFPYAFWKRYLSVFEQVRVVARVTSDPKAPTGARADGPDVSFAALPYYRGPQQFFGQLRGMHRAMMGAFRGTDAIILRLPSAPGLLAEPWLRETGRPFAIEVVGDPWDALAPRAVRHPLRGLFRHTLARSQERLCAASHGSLYVTRQALQKRYPPRPGTFTVGCSDVDLPAGAFVEQPRWFPSAPKRPLLISVGSLNHLYKGQDVLIDAVARCVERGNDLRLAFAGDGRYRQLLDDSSRLLGMSDRILFRGQIALGEDVRRELDAADLFVLPSRQEGLPRALLEAMARGLPAIGSTVGGIPELLPAEDLVAPGDAVALADKIEEVLRDAARLQEMSARNLATSRAYEETLLAAEHQRFLSHVRKETEAWLARSPDPPARGGKG